MWASIASAVASLLKMLGLAQQDAHDGAQRNLGKEEQANADLTQAARQDAQARTIETRDSGLDDSALDAKLRRPTTATRK